MKEGFKLVVLAGKGYSTWVLLNAIKSEFTIDTVFIEDSPPAYRFWWRRARKLGIFTAFGQMLFLLYYVIQRCLCKNRIDNILKMQPWFVFVITTWRMMQAIRDARGGKLRIQPSQGVSKQYHHPTLWNYLVRRWRSKVR